MDNKRTSAQMTRLVTQWRQSGESQASFLGASGLKRTVTGRVAGTNQVHATRRSNLLPPICLLETVLSNAYVHLYR